MTVYLPIEAKVIDEDLTIINILPGGCVKGPRISGKVIAPSADWRRATQSGSFHTDVRLTIKTDDGVLIYMTYGGVRVSSKEANEALDRGEVLNEKACLISLRRLGLNPQAKIIIG